MKNFKYVVLLILILGTVGVGMLTEKFCYRYPTVVEMKDYHEGHYSTEVVTMEELSDEGGVLTFRAKHTNGKGFTESYRVETGKAWVYPWETYWDSRKRMKEDKQNFVVSQVIIDELKSLDMNHPQAD